MTHTVDSIMALTDNYAQVTRWSNDGSSDEARAALLTALQEFAAERVGEPVAKLKPCREGWFFDLDNPPPLTGETILLYAAPQPAQPAQPVAQPLTDEEIYAIVRNSFECVPLPYDIRLTRAIEKHHGIGAKE